MKWFTVDELTPEEGRDILLYGKSVSKISLAPNSNNVVEGVFSKGEYINGKYQCEGDRDFNYGLPWWKFVPSHWCYITKPKK